MEKKALLKVVNVFLALSFVLTAIPGFIKAVMPDLIPYDKFSTLHPIFGISMIVCAVLHIILNWNWIKANFGGKK